MNQHQSDPRGAGGVEGQNGKQGEGPLKNQHQKGNPGNGVRLADKPRLVI